MTPTELATLDAVIAYLQSLRDGAGKPSKSNAPRADVKLSCGHVQNCRLTHGERTQAWLEASGVCIACKKK